MAEEKKDYEIAKDGKSVIYYPEYREGGWPSYNRYYTQSRKEVLNRMRELADQFNKPVSGHYGSSGEVYHFDIQPGMTERGAEQAWLQAYDTRWTKYTDEERVAQKAKFLDESIHEREIRQQENVSSGMILSWHTGWSSPSTYDEYVDLKSSGLDLEKLEQKYDFAGAAKAFKEEMKSFNNVQTAEKIIAKYHLPLILKGEALEAVQQDNNGKKPSKNQSSCKMVDLLSYAGNFSLGLKFSNVSYKMRNLNIDMKKVSEISDFAKAVNELNNVLFDKWQKVQDKVLQERGIPLKFRPEDLKEYWGKSNYEKRMEAEAAGRYYAIDEENKVIKYNPNENHYGKQDKDISETAANMAEIAKRENMPVEAEWQHLPIRAEVGMTPEQVLKDYEENKRQMLWIEPEYQKLAHGEKLSFYRARLAKKIDEKTGNRFHLAKKKLADVSPVAQKVEKYFDRRGRRTKSDKVKEL